MAKLYVQAVPPPDLNKNTEWFMYPGVWTTYIFILFVSWLLILSIFGCTPGMAWTLVNLGHFAVPASPLSLISPALSWIRISMGIDCLLG
uniref:ORM1-like protein 3 n=1 Tax=Aegilops tauschii subsp. strangulata TaxID=200361 RepID=A0A453CLY6_AEGTS